MNIGISRTASRCNDWVWGMPFLGGDKQKISEYTPESYTSFNPFEKYSSKWESSPNCGENDKYLKPPPSIYRYQEWPYFKPEVHLFQAIHPFGALQPLVFGDVCCSGWNLVPFSGDFRSIFRGVNQTIQSINQSLEYFWGSHPDWKTTRLQYC